MITLPPISIDHIKLEFFRIVITAVWVIIATWILGYLVRWVLTWGLRILTIGSHANQGLTRKAIYAQLMQLTALPARYLALMIALNSATFFPSLKPLLTFCLHIAFTLTSIAVGLLVGRIINRYYLVPGRSFRIFEFTVSEQLLPFAYSFVWGVIVFFGTVANLATWGFDATGLVAGTGLIGLAISLAAKDSAENLLGYFVIIIERPFLIGDYIKTGDVTGSVESVGWRSTKVRQLDQVLVSVPNRSLTSANIYNWFRMTKQLVECILYIAPNTPASSINALLQDIRTNLKAYPHSDANTITAVLRHIGKDSFEIGVTCYVVDVDRSEFSAVQEEIYLRILQVMEAQNIFIMLPPPAPLPAPATVVVPANTVNGQQTNSSNGTQPAPVNTRG